MSAKPTRNRRGGRITNKRLTGSRAGTIIRVETRQHGTTVTVRVQQEPNTHVRDEEIFWPGPETAEEIIADIYSRR